MRDLNTVILVALMQPVFILRREKGRVSFDAVLSFTALERLTCALSVARQYLPTAPSFDTPTVSSPDKAGSERMSQSRPGKNRAGSVFFCLCGGATEHMAEEPESRIALKWIRKNYSSTSESLEFIWDDLSQDTLQNVIYARREIDRYLGEVRARVIAVSSSWHLRFFEAVRLVFKDPRFLLGTASPPCDPSTYDREILQEQGGLRIVRESLAQARHLEEAPTIYHRLKQRSNRSSEGLQQSWDELVRAFQGHVDKVNNSLKQPGGNEK